MSSNRYILSNDSSEFIDVETNLIWQNSYLIDISFTKAKLYIKRISLDQEINWRMPTYDELLTLRYDEKLEYITPDVYWSSTETKRGYHIYQIGFDFKNFEYYSLLQHQCIQLYLKLVRDNG